MRATYLAIGFLTVVVANGACSDNDNTTNPTGTAGTGVAGTGAAGTGGTGGTAGAAGAAGAAGGAGTTAQAFVAVDPCPTAASYVAGNTVTVSPTQFVYTPACIKVSAGSTVTIGASAIHPLSGTTDGSAGNPIPMHQMTPQAVTFPTPGFYSFHCDIHFSIGMKGVVWVTP
jgi:plastocyanin